jgi:hypothetical protein
MWSIAEIRHEEIHIQAYEPSAYLTYRQGPITSCFIKRILKRFAPARPESANKSA